MAVQLIFLMLNILDALLSYVSVEEDKDKYPFLKRLKVVSSSTEKRGK